MEALIAMAGENQTRRILVTGIADQFAGEVMRQLEADDSLELIAGVDFREPRRAFSSRAEVMMTDLRSRSLRHILDAVRPDTVLHLQHVSPGDDEASADEAHEINVMGTINLVASLQRTASMRKFVLMSSTHIYGGDPTDSAILTEDTKPRIPAKSKLAGDLIEMESVANLFARGERKIALTCLRFADIIGRHCDTQMARYLRMPIVPSLWGYDPRLQFCHEADAIAIVTRAALEEHGGLYNVAGDGAVYLSQATRLGGRTRIPIAPPLFAAAISAANFAGLTALDAHHVLALRYGRVIDNAKAKARFGGLRYTTRDAVLDLYGTDLPPSDIIEAAPEESQVAAA
jgi:UDP-glucose 4-epimerase